MRKLFSTLTAIVAAAFIVDAVQAADIQWQAVGGNWDGNWSSSAHWVGGVLPTNSDRAVFPASTGGFGNYTVTVDGDSSGSPIPVSVAQRVDANANCSISIGSGKELRIGSADGQTSTMDGPFVLTSATSVLKFMFDHTIQPRTNNGSDLDVILGQNNSASVDGNGGSTLQLIQNGSADAMASGAFTFNNINVENDTLIRANNSSGGALTFANTATYDSANSAGILRIGTGAGAGPYASMRFEGSQQLPTSFAFSSLMTIVQYGTLDLQNDHNFTTAKPNGTSPFRIVVGSGKTVGFSQ